MGDTINTNKQRQAGGDRMESFNCIFCKSRTREEAVNSFTLEKDNSIIIIKNTPCLKCTQCGEVYYSNEIAGILESVTDHLYETVKAELLITDYKSAVLAWDPDYTRLTKLEESRLIGSYNEQLPYHAHCPICTSSYTTDAEMSQCFNSHTEPETLRWIANCVHNDKIWQEKSLKELDYALWENIDDITVKFNISDDNY